MSNHEKPRGWNIQVKNGRVLSGSGVYMDAENVEVIELSAHQALESELASLRAENEKLKTQPRTFIKLDETTEAFQQTRAAIENMKMFQKDTILLQHQLHESNKERDELKAEMEAAEKEIAGLRHEVERYKMLIKIADLLITNENAIKDWEDAKQTRIM